MKASRATAMSRALVLVLATAALFAALASPAAAASARWVTGDIHNHTYLSDGSSPQGTVVLNAFSVYGLDYLANCDHGGFSTKDPKGVAFVAAVPRWLTLSNYSFPLIADARAAYRERRVIQGMEWNAPTHEHVSVGIVGAGNEPSGISNFEYLFDAADTDLSRVGEGTVAVKDSATGEIFVPAAPFTKYNTTHDDMLTAAGWLQETYGLEAYAVVNHPSRVNRWHVGDFRALNDAAPDVCFGFEGLPGHQPTHDRGGYSTLIKADGTTTSDPALADTEMTSHARTYGGADWMTATVGGVWDALLGEGRDWWVFNNSDYHVVDKSYKDAAGNTVGLAYYDFWPGQYQKTYTSVDAFTDEGIVNGMRSGNSFVVNGDLINGLKFTAAEGARTATMGGTLTSSAGKNLTVSISVRSPKANNNYDPVKLDHIDVIAGDVTGPIPAEVGGAPNLAYTQSDTNASTKVVKTFTKEDWKVANGWMTMSFKVKAANDMYFRLRGTNLAAGSTNQTDAQGNPLIDELDYVDYPNPKTGGVKADGSPDLIHGNTPENCWADLWFYSNPVRVDVK
jgi:hypothetical protein